MAAEFKIGRLRINGKALGNLAMPILKMQ